MNPAYDWICGDCGRKHGRIIRGHISTMHVGVCNWCHREIAVTQPRDFGYPKPPLKKEKAPNGKKKFRASKIKSSAS